jgi:4-amino-4-deoxy-L-arabinose transferase-like glycosyltransferase
VAVASGLLWYAAYRTRFTGLWYPDACDYAQLGRQLIRGEALSSSQSFPYVLSWLDAHGHDTAPPWPNITRFALPPLLRAAAFATLGTSDAVALLPNALFFVGTAILAFLMGNRLAGPVAGLSAALLTASSPTALQYAVSGLTEPGAGFFLIAIGYVALRARSDPGLRFALLLGALVGLGFLQRSNLVFALPGAVWIVAGSQRAVAGRSRIALVAWTLATAGLVTAPWLLRNLLEFGSPLISLTTHRALGFGLLGRDLFLDFGLEAPWALIAGHWDVILGRTTGGWLVESWRELFGPELRWLGPAFLVALLLPLGGDGRALKLYAASVVGLTFLLVTTLYSIPRYYHPFVPLLLVLVTAAAFESLRRAPTWARRPAWGVAGLFVAACAGY